MDRNISSLNIQTNAVTFYANYSKSTVITVPIISNNNNYNYKFARFDAINFIDNERKAYRWLV